MQEIILKALDHQEQLSTPDFYPPMSTEMEGRISLLIVAQYPASQPRIFIVCALTIYIYIYIQLCIIGPMQLIQVVMCVSVYPSISIRTQALRCFQKDTRGKQVTFGQGASPVTFSASTMCLTFKTGKPSHRYFFLKSLRATGLQL